MLKIDYKFKDESLLRLAMTHSSYANEHHGTHLQCNERLEFLGDSVLGFVTAGYLFTHYPDLPEGDLTKLRAAVVCEGALDEIAHEIGIPEAIRLGHGEEMGGGRKRASILADATEALLGAIFMDGGIEPARAFVLRFIPHKVEVALAGGAFKDYKTMLQEIVQKNKQETLEYRLAGQSGPDHDKRFKMELLLNSNVFAEGIGKSKKEAEDLAYHYLDVVGLRDKAHVYPTTLSGGQQQRIAIARALCAQTKIILFDEPTSALDPETIQEVLDVMIKLAKENITMVVVTHEMGFARQVADRIVFMADGQIIEEGTPDHFFDNPSNERVKQFLGKIIR